MYLPNYHDGSIVNLMSSISAALGGMPRYQPLSALPPAELSPSTHTILLVLDGLGYDYLCRYRQQSFLGEHLRDKMTSVFPSTTAACVTTFGTGVAPQQHAVTGWFMYLKELGTVSAILRYRPRNGGSAFSQAHIPPHRIFRQPSFFSQIQAKSYLVIPKGLAKSDYNQATSTKAKIVSYSHLNECFRAVRQIIRSSDRQKYIYAYWPEFDSLSHKYGNNSPQVADHFKMLDRRLSSFAASLAGSDTTLIITADHGFIDSEPAKTIELKHHPRLQETLTLPLCGESRAAYCYVRPSKAAQFEAYVAESLGHSCEVFRSETLIAHNYFGLFEPNPRLFERVGDYVLVMKDNYVIKDFILGELERFHIGYHGGVSQGEMFVPLVVIKK